MTMMLCVCLRQNDIGVRWWRRVGSRSHHELSAGIRRAGVEGSSLALPGLLDLAIKLRGGCLNVRGFALFDRMSVSPSSAKCILIRKHSVVNLLESFLLPCKEPLSLSQDCLSLSHKDTHQRGNTKRIWALTLLQETSIAGM